MLWVVAPLLHTLPEAEELVSVIVSPTQSALSAGAEIVGVEGTAAIEIKNGKAVEAPQAEVAVTV